MALPYTLALANTYAVSGVGAAWAGAIPASRITAAAASRVELVVNASGNIAIFIGGATAGPDFDAELESARLIVRAAGAGREFWRGTLDDADPTEPYLVGSATDGTALVEWAIATAANGIELHFEDAVTAVDASAGTVSSASPTATAAAAVASATAVTAQPGAVSLAAPSALLAATPAADPVDARPGTVSGAAPSAALALSSVSATPRDAQPGTVATAAPSATLRLSRRNAAVNADPGAVATAAPAATLAADPVDVAVDAALGTVSLASPAAQLRAQGVGFNVDAALGTVSLASPTAIASAAAGDLREDYEVAIRAAAPAERVLTCVELRHPAAIAPVRLVNDTESRTVSGETYVRSRFEVQLADDLERRSPRAQLVVGNVGRDIQQWVELIGGGAGGTARVFEVIAIDGAEPEWEMTLDLAGVVTDSAHVTASLGFDPLLGRPAVALRFDPQTAPGLF